MSRVVFALGSNLGDRIEHLRSAVAEAAHVPELHDLVASPVYETEPVGGPAQDAYLNAVLVAESDLSPMVLLALAHEWEQLAGRERNERWGPRTLDVDLIAVGDVRSHTPRLTLPHPLAHERGFVLAPWHDVEPDAVLAGHGSVVELLANLHHAGVVRRDELDLHGAMR
ncbi:MAG: 2-amino-4-hydroxy-6-hydroxymethyldihydropteridine diphosphokinase [Frankiales bacterium]|jgi:2-amino-4-hydroxy-6-hydroxymethyldihydropteridine diphosphokinase|nr:2-amino-4-hydroxy-6-hydroxymethyldihydropteridine diphosphokinase [Frankiales bacterium]